jgi:hypothetical protein
MGNRNSIPSLRLVDHNFFKEEETNQEWKQIRRKRLINSLNRINFQEGAVSLNFKHPRYNYTLSLPATPQPCTSESLNCIWDESIEYKQKLKDFDFQDFHFTDGLKKILVEAELLDINKDGVQLSLPKISQEIRTRRVKRYQCDGVSAQLSQDGIVLDGEIKSFSAVSFSVHFPKESSCFHQDLNRKNHVRVVLKKDSEPLYSGLCEIYRVSDNPEKGKSIVLIPVKSHIQRFKPKRHRSIRQKLLPSPNIIFKHPLTGKTVNLKVLDISGAGFSVEEDIENSLLIPGLVVPDLSIELMNGIELKCKTQVIYRRIEELGHIKCGLTYLDMPLRDQIRLSSLLDQINNENAYVCTKVDINELWDFFFETGFIYPQKYSFIHTYKKEFNNVYKKLYENNPDISINFMCRDNGSILAHMSMLRFYEKTWLINHHAANSSKSNKAGLVVLEQIGRYINEFHRLPSTQMDYVSCYYRPQNKFPNFVFGGVARKASENNGCSVDEFAYLRVTKSTLNGVLPDDWLLEVTVKDDLIMLEDYYEKEFGGLTLKSLDVSTSRNNVDTRINGEFQSVGLSRARYIFSLKHGDKLVAIFVVNISDFGISLSDLTNCIQLFVLEPDNFPNKILNSAIHELSVFYRKDKFPVLIFPSNYVVNNSIPFDKIYNYWVLDVDQHSDHYFDHLVRLMKRSK